MALGPVELNERQIRRIFRISVVLKGLHALLEVGGGILLYVVSTQTIASWVDFVTQDELVEDPHDILARHLAEAAHHLSVGTQSFYAFYLLSHGLVKIPLVIGLLKEKLWAYPITIVVLFGFIGYQFYRYTLTHSFGLIVLTIFDVFVLVLVIHEWRVLKRHFAARRRLASGQQSQARL